jgi:dTDP-glucose 4,6-dehydratase
MTYMHQGGHQIRDWLYVRDHCAAIWELEEQRIINDHFNIGGSCEKQNIDVAKMILDMMNKPHDLIGVNNERPGIDKRYGMDHSKISNRIGWRPTTDFEVGLRATVTHYIDLLT